MTPILSWFNDETETLKKQLTHPEDAPTTDLVGVSPTTYYHLSLVYDIETIGQLVDYVITHGFPTEVELSEETKFVLSARAANKLAFF